MKLGQAAQIAKGNDWLPSRYYAYLQHRNLEAERDAIMKIMTRPKRVREKSWSASSAGSCLRQRQFVYLGFPKKKLDEKTMNIFTNGDYVHIRHQAIGMAAGYLTEAEVPVEIPGLKLKGTMDGVLSNGAIVEYKSINDNGYKQVCSFGPKKEHLLQFNSYAHASFIEQGHIVYENKNTNQIKEFIVTKDEALVDQVLSELHMLLENTDAQKLHPMLEECTRKEGAYRWCAYAAICPKAKFPGQGKLRISPTSSSVSD